MIRSRIALRHTCFDVRTGIFGLASEHPLRAELGTGVGVSTSKVRRPTAELRLPRATGNWDRIGRMHATA